MSAAQDRTGFREEIVAGLLETPKRIDSKFFYDARGAELFEEICELEEYYPTRTEIAILNQFLPEIAKRLGPQIMLIEFGSGAGLKTRMLLDAIENPSVYVPIDISSEQLAESVAKLEERYPSLEVLPVSQDYNIPVEIPIPSHSYTRKVVFFPGSTIGNFQPKDAVAFLHCCLTLFGKDGAVVLGVDLVKNTELLERAYNDNKGVTAEFNLHLIERIRDELHVAIDPSDFRHFAFFNAEASRIEMHLVANRCQEIAIGDAVIRIEQGEHIITEYSYKYSDGAIKTLVAKSGLRVEDSWTDSNHWFGEYLLVPA
jgi:dimethylhistidine N-methyltransferase